METRPETFHQSFRHARFGDLSRQGAVHLHRNGVPASPVTFRSPRMIHLSVTGRCQARCPGCINAAFTGGDRDRPPLFQDTEPERDAACIVNLVRSDPGGDEGAIICLYGGEPLLEPEKIRTVVDTVAAAGLPHEPRYLIYTNGELLVRTAEHHPELLGSLWLLSVSIDGGPAQHNFHRPGTDLFRIRKGLAAARPLCAGKVIIWSTLREQQSLMDCFREYLTLHDKGLADMFFWHWQETETPFADLASYASRYEQDLVRIMDEYLHRLRRGEPLPVVHINELVVYLLAGARRDSTACGVELLRNFDLQGGRIFPCADLPSDSAIGRIEADGVPRLDDHIDLSDLITYKAGLGCSQCGIHDYCGGRCPVQARIGGTERLFQYCQLLRLHVAVVTEYLPEIAGALKQSGLTVQDLYDQAGFYAQFTDVIP